MYSHLQHRVQLSFLKSKCLGLKLGISNKNKQTKKKKQFECSINDRDYSAVPARIPKASVCCWMFCHPNV